MLIKHIKKLGLIYIAFAFVSYVNAATIFDSNNTKIELGAYISQGLTTGSSIFSPNNGSSTRIGESFKMVNDDTMWYISGTYNFNQSTYVGFYGSTNFLVNQTGSDGTTVDDVTNEIFSAARASYLFVGNETIGEVKFGRNSSITDNYGWGPFIWYTGASEVSAYGYRVNAMGFEDTANNLINYSKTFDIGNGKSIIFEAEVSPNPQKGAATLNYQLTNPNTWVPNNIDIQDGFYAENTQSVYLAYNSQPFNLGVGYQHANGTTDNKNGNFIQQTTDANGEYLSATITNVSNRTVANDYASPTMTFVSADAGVGAFRAYAIYKMSENVASLGSESNYLEFDLMYNHVTGSESVWSNYVGYIYETGRYKTSYVNSFMGGARALPHSINTNDTVIMQKAILLGTAYTFGKSNFKIFAEAMFDIRAGMEIGDFVSVREAGGSTNAQQLSGNTAYVQNGTGADATFEPAGPNLTLGFIYSF